MMTKILRFSFFLIFLPLLSCSTPPATGAFQSGKEYQVLTKANGINLPSNKIQVIEFFSYGCPWCYHIEPELEAWLTKKPQNIEFERVPVVFEQGWDTLAKIYYTTKSMGISEKLILPIFTAIQQDNQNLSDMDTLKKFLASKNINYQDFDNAFNFSPGIDAQMMRGENLMRTYGIYAIPAFVIDGKYVTTMGMANGDSKRLLKIVDYLVAKEQQGANFVKR